MWALQFALLVFRAAEADYERRGVRWPVVTVDMSEPVKFAELCSYVQGGPNSIYRYRFAVENFRIFDELLARHRKRRNIDH